ncbi:long-chain fatty acid--CoA ligase [Kineosporia sp. A_224]|uniref:AMP-dependent synthetase/ligase n=1 Tax=Kineosporia sp. A_224 TaxID=1962180 RepID=UPI000B4B5D17|nr:AMP-dependent synthetase/ligase [Kineosporia sp. A_224]
MRESSVPAIVTPDPQDNLTDLVVRAVQERPSSVMFSRRVDGVWQDVTAEQFGSEVVALAKGLVAGGVRPGDRVAIMSKTRYEWTLADFAIWSAGAVTVPIYETSSAEQVSWILSDSGAVAVFAETAGHTSTVAHVRDTLPALREVWTIDDGAVDALVAAGGDVEDAEITRRRRSLDGASVATIIYTSGTTGRPKGCELTHANFGDLAANAVARLGNVVSVEGASTLLFLPLAHVFARFIQVLAVASGARLGHTADVKNLIEDLGGFRPTFVLAVPRVFEKIYNSAEAKAEAGGKGKIFHAAADTAIAWSQAVDTGRVPLTLKARHALFDRLVYGKLRATLGGQVQYAVSGGAPLGTRLGHFFRGVGVTVLEGWGLTETTAPATVNTPEKIKIGTVGLPLPGVTVKVADDGELLVKGVNVLRGYFNNPTATADCLDDGWFHTGDLGEIDSDGYVRITGRKKEIIVTAGGKNVAPSILEDRLRAHALVSQCMVVGDQRPFIAALVTLDAEMLPTWLANSGKPPMDVAAAAQDPDVRAEVQRAVDHANQAVSKAESIRSFVVLDTDFTEAGGHLTPKLSLKRQVVLKEFAEQIEKIYS